MISKSLTGNVPHVWSLDPALDKSNSSAFARAHEEFLANGKIEVLPVREGAKLTLFTIGPLRRKPLLRIYNMDGIDRLNEAVAYGLKNVVDYIVDGRPVMLAWDKNEEPGMGKRITAECLDEIFDPLLFAELGKRILDISHLDPTRGQV